MTSPPDALHSSSDAAPLPGAAPWRRRMYVIIFEADTRAGHAFDMALVAAIIVSVLIVIADSIDSVHRQYGALLGAAEWFFTALFTVEYLARLACVRRPAIYARSFFGIVDLLAILPTYLAAFFPQIHALIDIRMLRLLRLFRLLKLAEYVGEYRALGAALIASRRKILIFLSCVIISALILGTLMYVIEGPQNGYTSIPMAVYWAIVTMTTVGYGDVTPKTDMGKFIASVMMLIGWGILAVPTGIVSAEMTARRIGGWRAARACPACGTGGHDIDADFCKHCGHGLPAAATGAGSRPGS
ncbi:MAG: ion transporter [Gammaproteobacteria bacterium]